MAEPITVSPRVCYSSFSRATHRSSMRMWFNHPPPAPRVTVFLTGLKSVQVNYWKAQLWFKQTLHSFKAKHIHNASGSCLHVSYLLSLVFMVESKRGNTQHSQNLINNASVTLHQHRPGITGVNWVQSWGRKQAFCNELFMCLHLQVGYTERQNTP